MDAKTFSRVAVSNLATALLWFALNYVQQSLARQQSEFEESDEWEHTKNLLEHPASGSQVTAATKFIGDISEGTENGKVKSDRVTADTLPSTIQPLMFSQDLRNKKSFNFAPPCVKELIAGRSRTATAKNATRLKSLCNNRLGYLLVFSRLIAPAFAAEGSPIPTPQPSLSSILNEGPPALGSLMFAFAIANIILVYSFSAQIWEAQFKEPLLALYLLVFSTFGAFCIMSDSTTSRTTLLSIGALQLYFGQSFARMSHRMPNGGLYTMSIHFLPFIFALTVGFALLCMKASLTVYQESTQLPWFPLTIPCLGVAVIICVYLGYLDHLWRNRALLPQHTGVTRRWWW